MLLKIIDESASNFVLMGGIDAQYDIILHSVLLIGFWSFNIRGIPTDFRVDVGAMTLDSTHPKIKFLLSFRSLYFVTTQSTQVPKL